jgi:hypothetical protein
MSQNYPFREIQDIPAIGKKVSFSFGVNPLSGRLFMDMLPKQFLNLRK